MPSTVYIEDRFTAPHFRHAWRGGDGTARGSVGFGQSWVTFDDPETARELAAVLLTAANAMDALPPAEGGGEQ